MQLKQIYILGRSLGESCILYTVGEKCCFKDSSRRSLQAPLKPRGLSESTKALADWPALLL